MPRPIVAVLVAVAMLISACGTKLPDQISLPTEITGGDPKTLEAATTAGQELADRLTSGDFAGVWLMMSRQVRDNISQADFVTLQNACTKTGLPAHVTGVRMDGPTMAIVRWNLDLPVLSGFKLTKSMLYEDGKWVEAPDPEYAQDYGLPVQQIITKRIAAGHCDKTARASTDTTPSPTTEPQPPPNAGTGGSCSVNIPGCEGYDQCHPVVIGTKDCFPEDESCSKPGNTFPWCFPPPTPTTASTSDVSGASTGGNGKLVAVRLGSRDGYDRLVLEFLDGVPAYKIRYRPLPAHADGSGDEIPLPGASSFVQVTLTGATGSGWGGSPQTYFGPPTVSGDTAVVTEAKAAGDFETVLTWVVGLRSHVPFQVAVLDGPPRLVIDFQH